MVADRNSTTSSTAVDALRRRVEGPTAAGRIAAPRPAGLHPRRSRLARALTAVAASGALLVPASGAAFAGAAPGGEVTGPVSGSVAPGSEAVCLTASFPADQTRTTIAAFDEWLGCVGLTDGSTGADPGITRGEAAQIAYRSIGTDETASVSRFPDVQPGDAAYTAVSWLGQAGVVRGYPDGEFKPGQDISRDDLATVLVGAAITRGQLTGEAGPATSGPTSPVPEAAGPEATGAATAGPTSPAPEAPSPDVTGAPTGAGAPGVPAGIGTTVEKAYEQNAAGYLAQYGCAGVALDVVKTTGVEGATGVTTVTPGMPATVQIRADLDESSLEHTAAHECMHVLQHEVAGYSPDALDAMLKPYYAQDYTSSWGPVSIYEQNAECAIRSLGFTREQSDYDVACDAAGLQAGAAIASGQDPREVVTAD